MKDQGNGTTAIAPTGRARTGVGFVPAMSRLADGTRLSDLSAARCSAEARFVTSSLIAAPSSGSVGAMPINIASVGAMSTVRTRRSYLPFGHVGPDERDRHRQIERVWRPVFGRRLPARPDELARRAERGDPADIRRQRATPTHRDAVARRRELRRREPDTQLRGRSVAGSDDRPRDAVDVDAARPSRRRLRRTTRCRTRCRTRCDSAPRARSRIAVAMSPSHTRPPRPIFADVDLRHRRHAVVRRQYIDDAVRRHFASRAPS